MRIWKSFSIFLLLSIYIFPGDANAQVTHRDTVVSWQHFDYTLNADYGMGSYSTSNIVSTTFNGIVLENEYVRLVVIPEFGARIISFVYKPTGHEQLYQNPVGTPYGMGAGNFYYDWLMVYGGIFPTFPEPEHGKSWLMPWQWELIETTDERVSLQMSLQDVTEFPAHPWKFNNGVTEVLCTSTVTLEKGETSFDFHHTIENTRNTQVAFEYWTCTTLAPGSESGNTFTPENSEIIVPIDYVYLKDDWWSWMGNAEVRVPSMGSHVFEYDNLAWFYNWDDMGIAYAHPRLEGDYYGIINHENSEGIFRYSDNDITPGMKFWTWGAEQSFSADPYNFYDNARPYIELWSGFSGQFFEDATLSPNEIVSWTETYIPTVDISSIQNVTANGAINLEAIPEDDKKILTDIFMTLPDSLFELNISLNGDLYIPLLESQFYADAQEGNHFEVFTSHYDIPDGSYILTAEVSKGDQIVLSSEIPVVFPLSGAGISNEGMNGIKVLRLSHNVVALEFQNPGQRRLEVYDINGRLLQQQEFAGTQTTVTLHNHGIHLFRIIEENHSTVIKVSGQ
jgi:hypothetical protein